MASRVIQTGGGLASDTGSRRALSRAARPDDGRRSGPHWIDVRVLCHEVIGAVATRAAAQHVSMDLTLCASPARVIGYADRLFEAMLHLVSNALDAMPRGGTLSLRVDRDPWVVFECRDTGPGVPPDLAPRLWDAHDRMRGGGLPATRDAVEAHHGRITHHAPPGGGACFVVELPGAGPRSIQRPA